MEEPEAGLEEGLWVARVAGLVVDAVGDAVGDKDGPGLGAREGEGGEGTPEEVVRGRGRAAFERHLDGDGHEGGGGGVVPGVVAQAPEGDEVAVLGDELLVVALGEGVLAQPRAVLDGDGGGEGEEVAAGDADAAQDGLLQLGHALGVAGLLFGEKVFLLGAESLVGKSACVETGLFENGTLNVCNLFNLINLYKI